MTRTAATAELARLQAATPSKLASFNESRAARIVELQALIETLPAEAIVTDDERKTSAILARYEGGDQFDRGARRRGQVR